MNRMHKKSEQHIAEGYMWIQDYKSETNMTISI